MAIIGRVLEAQGFKVGIIAQPDWHSTRDFEALGEPRLFFGVTGGNMDSMVNRYTSDRRVLSEAEITAEIEVLAGQVGHRRVTGAARRGAGRRPRRRPGGAPGRGSGSDR